MNRLKAEAQQARTWLMAACEMDELDYHLMILEGGCKFLDHIVANIDVPEQVRQRYQYHLMDLGFWDWYVYRLAVVEVALHKRWTLPNSIMHWQDAAYKRNSWLQELDGMVVDNPMCPSNLHLDSFDVWLHKLGPRRAMKLQQQPQIEKSHVN